MNTVSNTSIDFNLRNEVFRVPAVPTDENASRGLKL